MENKENTNKKFRNPFPAVGKVFKYEMISVADYRAFCNGLEC